MSFQEYMSLEQKVRCLRNRVTDHVTGEITQMSPDELAYFLTKAFEILEIGQEMTLTIRKMKEGSFDK